MTISLITITYNSELSLSRTLESVKKQTYPHIEHILVDGASTDSTLSIIEDYAIAHPDTVRYVSEKDGGIYDAINKGIRMATGDVIGILNSDDILAAPDVLQVIADTFEKEGADITYGNLQYCNPAEKVIRDWRSNPFRKQDLRWGWMPAHPTVYMRRQVYEQEGLYYTGFRISADYDYMLRIFRKEQYKKVFINRLIVKMTVGGISNRSPKMMMLKTKEDRLALKRNHCYRPSTVIAKNLRKIMQFLR